MTWNALVPPRLGTQDATGMCLRFAQSFFGAPVAHPSAWVAWQHQQHRHGPAEPLPPVPVPIWFSHYGTYGSPPTYGNWGHVAIHVPGDAIYTSPAGGFGQGRYATIAQIERAFNATYVGWSEDINGLRVAEPGEEDDMFSDADRAVLNNIAKQTSLNQAIYDALFKRGETSQGYHAGVLPMLNAVYDAQFKETETSRGTPGGTLVSLREVISALEEVKSLIESNTDSGEGAKAVADEQAKRLQS